MLRSSSETAVQRAPTQHHGRRWSRLAQQEALAAYVFIAPFVLGLLIFTAFPMLFSLVISFHTWDLTRPPEWVGLENYRQVFRDPLVRIAAGNTILYVVFSVPLGLGLSFALALLLNQRVRGEGLWRTIFYIPSVVPLVATTILWMVIFNTEYGILNALLQLLGLPKIRWLTDPRFTKPSLILMSLWSSGGSTVILLAALKQVPLELYEAATIDGASAWQRFRLITIPMISPALFFQLVTGVIFSLQIFTQAYVLAGRNVSAFGGPRNSLLFFVPYLYQNAFRFFKLGYASALAWILFAVIITMTLVQFHVLGRRVYYEFDRPR
ncbi:carbohydrate ABC transporter permease [Kallotenue papyrolyticum]|uniref:carbohydrate ABC transporter permease n=1 Tax=Kallotenue papyrolyticum TaxID=1325125 RepID=UPI0004785F01|nr:sugar ABC transporter permease [Kallotenue papyrolyticum]